MGRGGWLVSCLGLFPKTKVGGGGVFGSSTTMLLMALAIYLSRLQHCSRSNKKDGEFIWIGLDWIV